MGETKTQQEQEKKSTRLNEENMNKAVKQIVFDLGVSPEQAKEWAEEAQENLLQDQKMVTREVVVVVADAKHVDDEDVPAELVPRNQDAKKWPGTDLVMGVVDAVKNKYEKVKN